MRLWPTEAWQSHNSARCSLDRFAERAESERDAPVVSSPRSDRLSFQAVQLEAGWGFLTRLHDFYRLDDLQDETMTKYLTIETMWLYLLVFLAALIVDTIPVFAPPAWIVLVLLLLTFHLNPWLVVIIGVAGSTVGRYILSLYIAKISAALVSRHEDENLRYVGSKLAQTPLAASTFIFLYTLTPLSTTALFTAAGMAHVNPWHILPPFFCGRLITDGVMV